jgi:hypothetical protein
LLLAAGALYWNSEQALGDWFSDCHYVAFSLASSRMIQSIKDILNYLREESSNNPNDLAKEHDDPKYILNLLKRIITVSVETMKIVNALPPLNERNAMSSNA